MITKKEIIRRLENIEWRQNSIESFHFQLESDIIEKFSAIEKYLGIKIVEVKSPSDKYIVINEKDENEN